MDHVYSTAACHGTAHFTDRRQLPPMYPLHPASSSHLLEENSVIMGGLCCGYSMQDPRIIARHDVVAMQGSALTASPRKRLDVRMRLKQPSQEDWQRWKHDIVRLYRKEAAPAIVKRLRLNGYNVT